VLESPALQLVVFPVGVLYLLLHAGPMFRLWYEPSIRGGTAWRFFASEVALFAAWALCSPAVWHSPVGRAAIALHIGTHLLFTVLDASAHDFLVGTALIPRQRSPLLWFAKEAGLVVDTLTHAVVVSLAARAMPPVAAALLCLPSLAGFAWVTRGYLRAFRRADPAA
jgi:hypothetical protein